MPSTDTRTPAQIIRDAYTDDDTAHELLAGPEELLTDLAEAIREETDEDGQLVRGQLSSERIEGAEAAIRRAVDMTYTTTDTLTDSQIESLRRDADEAGDLEQVAVCLVALGADRSDAEPGTALAECMLTQEQARRECAEAISDAEAARD